MAEVQAQALYSFDGDLSAGELAFKEGETLTILSQNAGDGWWEARNRIGRTGLIPLAYVEVIEPPEPAFPPPPPPKSAISSSEHNGWSHTDGGGGGGSNAQTQQSSEPWDDDDDDWDDDEDGASSTSTGGAPTTYSQNNQQELQGTGNFGLSKAKPNRESTTSLPSNDMSKYGTVKKSFNRFSMFAKAGGEAYIMGNLDSIQVSEADKIAVIETQDGIEWKPTSPFTCTLRSPKKESKLKGLKTFIAYQLTPSFSNIQVSRRFKHFDWLHIQLENKFTCIPIPPLPDKAISGRYEDEFIDHRMKLLQMWINRICRHPVLSQSEVFQHFLTCTDEKKWKKGKRKAEKDEYMGGKFFVTLKVPNNCLQITDVDTKMETFCSFQKSMEDNVKVLLTVAHNNRKKHLGPFKREYQKLGGAFKTLSVTFAIDTSAYSSPLTGAIDFMGDTYNQIGDLFEKQPRNDLDPLLDTLNEYKGILTQFPDVLKVHEGAIGKAKECKKLVQEGKMEESLADKVTQRADVITFGTIAEIDHFQKNRTIDFKNTMSTFLTAQIKFYEEITNKLKDALARVEKS